jgi:hypothetical protein
MFITETLTSLGYIAGSTRMTVTDKPAQSFPARQHPL